MLGTIGFLLIAVATMVFVNYLAGKVDRVEDEFYRRWRK